MSRDIMYYDGDMVEILESYEEISKSLVRVLSTNRRRFIYTTKLTHKRSLIKVRINDSYVKIISKR